MKDYGYPQYMVDAAVFGGEEREKTGVMECWSIGVLLVYKTADDYQHTILLMIDRRE